MESSSYKNHGEESWLLVLDPVPIRLSLPYLYPSRELNPFVFKQIHAPLQKLPGVGAPLCRPPDRPIVTITVSWFTNHRVPLQPVALGATIGKAREFFAIRGNNGAALGV